jgi:hypothetical protein
VAAVEQSRGEPVSPDKSIGAKHLPLRSAIATCGLADAPHALARSIIEASAVEKERVLS